MVVHGPAEPVAAGPSLVQDQKVFCKTHLKVQMEIPQGSLLFKEIKTEVRSSWKRILPTIFVVHFCV